LIQSRRLAAYAWLSCSKEVLLSKLNRGPNKGKWNLIGGAIEHGETPEKALLREIQEESGIELENPGKLLTVLSEVIPFRNSDNRMEELHLLGVIYTIQLPGKPWVRNGADGESSDECQWFSIDQIANVDCVSFVRKAMDCQFAQIV
jgi:8-oxo-dGTP diphosphatase